MEISLDSSILMGLRNVMSYLPRTRHQMDRSSRRVPKRIALCAPTYLRERMDAAIAIPVTERRSPGRKQRASFSLQNLRLDLAVWEPKNLGSKLDSKSPKMNLENGRNSNMETNWTLLCSTNSLSLATPVAVAFLTKNQSHGLRTPVTLKIRSKLILTLQLT